MKVRPAWQQVTATLTEAIRSGILAPGDELPSITELSALQGIGTGVIRHALEALTADGLIIVRHGRAAVVAGEPSGDPRLSRRRPGPGHDCRRAGCRPHVCHPMKPSTIRGIHSILSGAFAAAHRWEWTDRNPAESVHVAFNYVVRGGQRVRKDTKTHQDRWLAIDPDTCALIATYRLPSRTVVAARYAACKYPPLGVWPVVRD